MSDYSDCYYELHKEEIERENKANNCRRRLINEISIDNMIEIIFEDFINKKDDYDAIKIAEEYLKI